MLISDPGTEAYDPSGMKILSIVRYECSDDSCWSTDCFCQSPFWTPYITSIGVSWYAPCVWSVLLAWISLDKNGRSSSARFLSIMWLEILIFGDLLTHSVVTTITSITSCLRGWWSDSNVPFVISSHISTKIILIWSNVEGRDLSLP